MAEESDSLKEEMSALLRADLERARQKRVEPPATHPAAPVDVPAPVATPEPDGLGARLRRILR